MGGCDYINQTIFTSNITNPEKCEKKSSGLRWNARVKRVCDDEC